MKNNLLIVLWLFSIVAVGWTADTLVFTTIVVPGAESNDGLGINDSGEVVGSYLDPFVSPPVFPELHGFLLSRGTLTTIDPPESLLTIAHGINNKGQIVGTYVNNGGEPLLSKLADEPIQWR